MSDYGDVPMDEAEAPVMPPNAATEWTPWVVKETRRDEHPTYIAEYVPGTGSLFSGPRLGSLRPVMQSTTIMERRRIALWVDEKGRKCGQVLEIETRALR